MSKYVVTGASGFIGINLVKKLAKSESNVIFAVVKDLYSDISSIVTLKNVQIIYCDLNNILELPELIQEREFDAFFHLAWDGSTGIKRSDYLLQMKNVVCSADAFKVAEQIGCKKFLCAGTISEKILYQINQLDSVSQNMMYALAKKNTFSLLNLLSKSSKVKFIWMQFSNVYGPYNKSGNLISYTLNEIKENRTPQFGNCMQPYNFIYIEDLIDAICCLEKSNVNKNKYFLGSSEILLLKDYLLMIPEVLGINIKLGIGERRDDGIKYKREWFDISDIVNDTSYISKYSFKVGLNKMLEMENGSERHDRKI